MTMHAPAERPPEVWRAAKHFPTKHLANTTSTTPATQHVRLAPARGAAEARRRGQGQGAGRAGRPALQVGPDDQGPRHYRFSRGQVQGQGFGCEDRQEHAEGCHQGPGAHH